MNIDVTPLNSSLEDYIEIDETYTFNEEELKQSGILKLEDMKITGDISKNNQNEYILDINLKGTMVLPCSITLKPVNYDFDIKIDGNIEEIYEEIGKKLENHQKTIDIFPIIWENILMEIPIKVTSDDLTNVKTSGEGWELITDED